MRIYFDMEFTGLHRETTPISFGAVSETGEKFYCEFIDYDVTQIDDWLQKNVIDNLIGKNRIYQVDFRHHFEAWLSRLTADKFVMASDCYAYDWVLFWWSHGCTQSHSLYSFRFVDVVLV